MACFFIATSYGMGSLSNYFFGLSRELAARGHRIVILVDGCRHDVERTNDNPVIITWPSSRPTRLRDARFFNGMIKRYRPRTIIANFSAVNISLLIGWLNRVPVRVAWNHTLMKQIAMDSGKSRWKLFLLMQRKRFVYRFATHLIANSGASAEDLRRYQGVDLRKVSVMPFLLPVPPPGRLEGREKRVVCAGRLSPSKGHAVLLRAIALIRTAVPDVIVEFVGDGPIRRELEDAAKSLGVAGACEFAGAVPHQEVHERMARASIVAVPSLSEAFGLVTIEAQSVGTPVVASDVDGIRETVVHGRTGFLVSPGNPSALAEKIIILLKDERLRSEFGRAARTRFEREYSDAGIPRHADYFERLGSI